MDDYDFSDAALDIVSGFEDLGPVGCLVVAVLALILLGAYVYFVA